MSYEKKLAAKFFKILEVLSKLTKEEKLRLIQHIVSHIEEYE